MVHAVDSKSTGGNTLGVRVPPPAPKCVDERCNAENAARKCGVFTYNALLLERKGCKNSIFQNSSFAPARGDISEMQQSTLADWCDLNTEAKKE